MGTCCTRIDHMHVHVGCVIPCPTCRLDRSKITPMLSPGIPNADYIIGQLEKTKFVFPLTEKDIYLLFGSWEIVRKDIIGAGMRMFARMFETEPQVKGSFEKFRSLGEGSAAMESKVLETHGMVVMSAVDEVINTIDDPDAAIQMLLEQGKSHARFGDLSEEIFWAIEKPFLHAVKESLGFKYSEHLNDIYSKTINFVLTVIVTGFRQELSAKYRHSVSGTLLAGMSGSLSLAGTAYSGRLLRHNVIQEDPDDTPVGNDVTKLDVRLTNHGSGGGVPYENMVLEDL